MTTDTLEETRVRGMRRSLLLARVGIVAWAVVVVTAIVLVQLAQPPWLWVLVAAFGALRLLMDVRRMRATAAALRGED